MGRGRLLIIVLAAYALGLTMYLWEMVPTV